MDHHLMKLMLDGWSYDDVWESSRAVHALRNPDVARPPARRKRRLGLSLRRGAHLRPSAGAAS